MWKYRSFGTLALTGVLATCGPLVDLEELASLPQHEAPDLGFSTHILGTSASPNAAVRNPTKVGSGDWVIVSVTLDSRLLPDYTVHAARLTAGPAAGPPVIDLRRDDFEATALFGDSIACWPFGGGIVMGSQADVWHFNVEIWTSLGRAHTNYEVTVGPALEGEDPAGALDCFSLIEQ